MNNLPRSIIYVNFAPYQNAGKILDFLKDNYFRVIEFSFNFHKLDKNQPPSMLTIYEQGVVTRKSRLYQTPINPSLAFLLLPIRSIIIFLQLLYHSIILNFSYGTIESYFTVNAFTAWCGNILRGLGLVRKTIFWVWDYYPPTHGSKIVEFMRWMYWQFDKPASLQADSLIFLNKRLETLRRKMNLLPEIMQYKSIGIGTDPIRRILKKKMSPVKLIFLGVIKKSQGLDIILDALSQLHAAEKIELHIIGGGPDIEYFRHKAKNNPHTIVFHGYIENEKKVTDLISKSHIGIAMYMPDPSNVSYYSDPSKIKRYISLGVPVVTTNVFSFSKEITLSKAGVVTQYRSQRVLEAITVILSRYTFYQINALNLSKKYNYKKLYRDLLS